VTELLRMSECSASGSRFPRKSRLSHYDWQ